MFINHLLRESIDNCRLLQKILLSRAVEMPFALPAFPYKFPPENSKLHFPLIMTVSVTNLGKYINIYF